MITHQIQRQTLEVVTDDFQDRLEVTDRVTSVFKEQVLPQLSILFDRLTPAGSVLNLDRLEISVPCYIEQIEEGLSEQILAAIKESLESYFKTANDASTSKQKDKLVLSRPNALVKAFTHYLDQGQFPWWFEVNDFTIFETEIIEKALPQLIVALQLKNIEKRVLQRILWQCSRNFVLELVAVIAPSTPKQKREFFFTTAIPYKVQLQVLQALLDPKQIVDRAFWRHWEKEVEKPKKKETKTIPKIKIFPAVNEIATPAFQEGEERFLSNAGLVLLAHLLETLFAHFELVEKGQFVDEEARARAVHLLHYLATGEEQAPETIQGMAKFLCGMPFEQALPRNIVLTEDEKAEAAHLLTLIITNWPKMESSTIDGLQTAFLQRPGKFYRKDNAWHIQVESDTLDVLLGFLPWGIGVVQLPWLGGGVVWVVW